MYLNCNSLTRNEMSTRYFFRFFRYFIILRMIQLGQWSVFVASQLHIVYFHFTDTGMTIFHIYDVHMTSIRHIVHKYNTSIHVLINS